MAGRRFRLSSRLSLRSTRLFFGAVITFARNGLIATAQADFDRSFVVLPPDTHITRLQPAAVRVQRACRLIYYGNSKRVGDYTRMNGTIS